MLYNGAEGGRITIEGVKPMIYKNVKLHNVAEVKESETGTRLYRFPIDACRKMGVRDRMHGREVALQASGCEIRFVTPGDRAMVTLTSLMSDTHVVIYRGDFGYYSNDGYSVRLPKGQATALMLNKSPAFEKMDRAYLRKPSGFSPDVWRIMIGGGIVTLNEIEDFGYDLRSPRSDEEPEKTLLVYGTSITHGACATAHSICYAQLLGRFLNVNLLNKGMGGSCMNEPEVAEYFASDAIHYDALYLENALNMSGLDEEMERNIGYLLKCVRAARPNLPIYMLTCFPNSTVVAGEVAFPAIKTTDATVENIRGDQVTYKLAKRYGCKIIEGFEMLPDFTATTHDMVHLSDYGHIMAATNIAAKIGKI